MRKIVIHQPLPKYVVSQSGRLYFQKVYDGVRYCAPLGLDDSSRSRIDAEFIIQPITAAMALRSFNPNDFKLLRRYHCDEVRPPYPTFEQYADKWLDKKKLLAASTFRNYKATVLNYLNPHFGKMRIDKIRKPVVEEWQIQVTKRISRTYANECLRRLKSILYDAEGDYDLNLRINRVKALSCYHVAHPSKDAIFTLEEASKLYYVMGRRLQTMMLCSMFAGLRTGEVIALKREDIDFERNRLHVRATMSYGERKSPKTRSGVRAVKMHPVLRKHLANYLASHDNEFVFISQRGKKMRCTQNFEREYKRAKELAQVRDIRWYGFRKLFASMRYACTDFVPAQIAGEMGHTNIAEGLNTYSEAIEHLGCRFEEIQFPIPPRSVSPEPREENAPRCVFPQPQEEITLPANVILFPGSRAGVA